MKDIRHHPRALVLGIAIALGFAAAGAGCTQGQNDADNTAMAPDNGAMTAGTGDSTQPVSDTWITTKVKSSLATTQGVDSSHIDVETNNGVVTLTGTASSEAEVTAAKQAASQVKGVTRVDASGLRVGGMAAANATSGGMAVGAGDSHQPAQDTWITTKVLAKLQTVDNLNNHDLHVETNDGVVMLTGRADSKAMVDAAVAAARTIKGVKDVDTSKLKIGPDTER